MFMKLYVNKCVCWGFLHEHMNQTGHKWGSTVSGHAALTQDNAIFSNSN